MLKRLSLILLLSAILLVLLTMTFAQDVPFHVEVLAQSARMRWGPGPTYVVQHYANSGHVLLVLEVDSESDPPWIWYYARTPSGVQSWIRADLVRSYTGEVPMQERVDNPTGTYPVRDNNFCNTNLFRACQQGTDFDLWEAGYWAKDRYDHWERGGWNLDVVYYLNPCRTERVCSTREQWDAGLIEAEAEATTLTPAPTQTPFEIMVTVLHEVNVDIVWDAFSGFRMPGVPTPAPGETPGPPNVIYNPPPQLRTTGATETDTGSIIGGFEFKKETVILDCQYWYRTESSTLVRSRAFENIDLKKLHEDVSKSPPDYSRCLSDNVNEDDVVARKWWISVTRSYSGRGRIRGVSWRLTATLGLDAVDPTIDVNTCTRVAPLCSKVLDPAWIMYIAEPTSTDDPVTRPLGSLAGTGGDTSCTYRSTTSGESPNEVTRYEHTCTGTGINTVDPQDPTRDWSHRLEMKFTHDQTRDYLPEPTDMPTDG